jgi:hypothetical protein
MTSWLSVAMSGGTIIVVIFMSAILSRVRLEMAQSKAEQLEKEKNERHELRNQMMVTLNGLESRIRNLEVKTAILEHGTGAVPQGN